MSPCTSLKNSCVVAGIVKKDNTQVIALVNTVPCRVTEIAFILYFN